MSLDELLIGLVAFILGATAEEDYREILVDVSLFFNSARKLRTDPKRLFNEACDYFPNQKQTSEVVLKYLDYPIQQQNIADMGYRETEGPNGFMYISIDGGKISKNWE